MLEIAFGGWVRGQNMEHAARTDLSDFVAHQHQRLRAVQSPRINLNVVLQLKTLINLARMLGQLDPDSHQGSDIQYDKGVPLAPKFCSIQCMSDQCFNPFNSRLTTARRSTLRGHVRFGLLASALTCAAPVQASQLVASSNVEAPALSSNPKTDSMSLKSRYNEISSVAHCAPDALSPPQEFDIVAEQIRRSIERTENPQLAAKLESAYLRYLSCEDYDESGDAP